MSETAAASVQAQNPQPALTAAAKSVSPELPRPALADRQCEAQRPETPKQGNTRKNAGSGGKQVPRAGTFSNSRIPRSTSASNNLPRGRSFQGSKPLSPHAQQAQEYYFQRKAAKLYAERRRAKADKENGGSGSGDVINITVDDKGVKIDNGKGSTQNGQGMGSRRNSRSRMSRSNSRQWNNSRSEEKENRHELGQRNADVDIEAYFNRKRGSGDARRNRDSFGGNTGSWDGSMPKRQNSKSFIEKRRESMNSKSAAEKAGKPEATKSSTKPEVKPESKLDATPAAVSDIKSDAKNNGAGYAQSKQDADQKHSLKSESKPGSVAVAPEQAVLDVAEHRQSRYGEELEKKHTLEPPPAPSSTPAKEAATGTVSESKNPNSPTISSVSESGTEGDSKSTSPEPDKLAKRESNSSSPSNSGPQGSQKVPLQGKWCEDCAGLGLHISALLSEMEKHRSAVESGVDGPSTSSGSKKGWKNIVLGDSKSKSSSEKARLQQEVNVLKATVDYLYKKIELMEASPELPKK